MRTSWALWVCAAIWAVLLVSWLPAALVLSHDGDRLSNGDVVKLACLVGAALVWTVLWGALLGRRRAWAALGLSVPASAALLLACYVVAMILAPPQPDSLDGPQSDNEAAVGLVMLAVPTTLLMAALLGAGALIGLAARAIADRLRARALG